MSWYLLPSGMPFYAVDGTSLAKRILAEGSTVLDEDDVDAAISAWEAGVPGPVGHAADWATQLELVGYRDQAQAAASAAALFDGSRAAGKDVRQLGAVADEQSAVCSIATGSNVLTRASGAWTPGDVGKVLSVPNAMATADLQSRNTMPAKITGFTDATHVTLDKTAGASATAVTVLYATDNTLTLQAAMDAAYTGFLGDTFIFPQVGKPFYVDMLMPHSGQRVYGPGEVKQIPRNWNDAMVPTKQGGTIMPWNVPGSIVDTTDRVHVEGLRINGNKYAHYGSIANRTHGEGLNFKYGVKCTAAYNTIWDTNGDGIDRDHCTDTLVIGNHVKNASCWGFHTSEGNIGCRLIGNTATLCGWDLFVETGVSAGGFDCSQDSSKITYIGNVADGCRINYALGNSGLYDPAVYQLIAVGNRERSDAATPAYASSYQAVIPDIPDSITKSIDFTVGLMAHGQFTSVQPLATTTAFAGWAAGDVVSRWSSRASGTMEWGDGANAHDVSLFRSNADELSIGTGDTLRLQGGGWNTGVFRMGNYRFWVDATGALRVKSSNPTSDLDGSLVGAAAGVPHVLMFSRTGITINTTTGIYAGGRGSSFPQPVLRPGRPVGMTVWSNSPITAGSVTFYVRKNSAATNLTPAVTLDTTNPSLKILDWGYAAGPAFVAGEQLKVLAVADASAAPLTQDFLVNVHYQND